jgi:organic hydroperoxide reductase OsmC/OhrA
VGLIPRSFSRPRMRPAFTTHSALLQRASAWQISDDSAVDVAIGIGPDETSFAIDATITAHLPGINAQQAQELLAAAHQICPVLQGNARQYSG